MKTRLIVLSLVAALLLSPRLSSAQDVRVGNGFLVYTGYYYSSSWWTFLMMGGQPCRWVYAEYADGSGFYADSCDPSSNVAWF